MRDFIETDYSLLLSKFECEEKFLENLEVTPQYSPFQPKNLFKPELCSNQGTFGFPHPPTPTSFPLQILHPPPPPPLKRTMVDDIKQPIFKGTRSEYPEKFWLLCEAVWKMKQVHDENIKKV